MSDQPTNLVFDHLCAIRSDIGELKADIIEVKERLGFIESQYSSVSRRLDRMGGDVELIKRRLNFADA